VATAAAVIVRIPVQQSRGGRARSRRAGRGARSVSPTTPVADRGRAGSPLDTVDTQHHGRVPNTLTATAAGAGRSAGEPRDLHRDGHGPAAAKLAYRDAALRDRAERRDLPVASPSSSCRTPPAIRCARCGHPGHRRSPRAAARGRYGSSNHQTRRGAARSRTCCNQRTAGPPRWASRPQQYTPITSGDCERHPGRGDPDRDERRQRPNATTGPPAAIPPSVIVRDASNKPRSLASGHLRAGHERGTVTGANQTTMRPASPPSAAGPLADCGTVHAHGRRRPADRQPPPVHPHRRGGAPGRLAEILGDNPDRSVGSTLGERRTSCSSPTPTQSGGGAVTVTWAPVLGRRLGEPDVLADRRDRPRHHHSTLGPTLGLPVTTTAAVRVSRP